ncbi:MAG: DNA polymerase Y family protein [Pseudobdellovibrio sp.]
MLKWILFDLNSYFASCEQQEDPSIRNRPVAVVPSLANTTSVIAASYEAKKFGVKTGTLVGEAKKMCPGLILKTGNHKMYTHYHHRIVKAVEEVLPIKTVLSIDEMACELIGRERELTAAWKIAQDMKDHVRAVVGSEIKSSVGIGPNILVAKIASDMMKPDGLVAVDKDQILEKIGPLSIECIPGVGRQMKARLNAKNFFKVEDFMKLSEQELRKNWGSIWGLRIAKELQGEDLAWRRKTAQKSLSHQHVLPPDLRSYDKALQVLTKLTAKAAFRLREDRIKASRLAIYIRCQDNFRFENEISFSETDDTNFLCKQVLQLYKIPSQKRPFKVAIALSGLSDGPSQMSFFDNPKTGQINQALDTINSRFGPNTLYAASTQAVLKSAKTRIAFNHIPKLSDEFEDS